MKRKIAIFLTSIVLSSCNNSTTFNSTQQPTISDYQIGEKWVWKYKGVTKTGEVRSDGKDSREIIRINERLGMVVGTDTIFVDDIVKPEESPTPKYDWPLKVGKKWKYEKNWTSQDGTKGSQNQDVEVLFFKEETVEAGTFMAYTIKYKGNITNSRGYNASIQDVWLYAPSVKNFIKLTQTQDDFLYVEELVEYSKPE